MNHKSALTLILFLFLSVSIVQLLQSPATSAQTATASWSKTYRDLSPYGQAYATDIIQTSDGGYALVLGAWQAKTSNYGTILLKIDSSGNVEWNQTLGGPEQNSPASLIQTRDDGYAIGGFLDKNITTATGSKSVRLSWLVKTDSSGNTLWTKTYGDSYTTSEVRALIQTSDGGFVMAGDAGGDNTEGWAGIVIKTDKDGNQLWSKLFDTTKNDERFFSIVETTDGGFAMAGQTGGEGNIPRFWLVKADSNGNLQWNHYYENQPQSYDYASSLVQTSDGGFAIAGDTDNPNSVGPHSIDPDTHGQFWLIKTDASGNIQWNEFIGDRSHGATDIIQTLDGGFALSGCIAPYSWNTVLVKTDMYGQIQWTYNETGKNALKVIQTSDGGYVLAGETGVPSAAWVTKISASGEGVVVSPTASPTKVSTDPSSLPSVQPTDAQHTVAEKDGAATGANNYLLPDWWPYAAVVVAAVVCLTLGYLLGVRKTKQSPN